MLTSLPDTATVLNIYSSPWIFSRKNESYSKANQNCRRNNQNFRKNDCEKLNRKDLVSQLTREPNKKALFHTCSGTITLTPTLLAVTPCQRLKRRMFVCAKKLHINTAKTSGHIFTLTNSTAVLCTDNQVYGEQNDKAQTQQIFERSFINF